MKSTRNPIYSKFTG